MATATIVAFGSAVGMICSALPVPSLSTVVVTTGGPLVVRWALGRYMRSSGGNYYYVYQLATGDSPVQIPGEEPAGALGAFGTALSAATSVVSASAKAAMLATGLAVSSAVAAGSMLIFTVTASGTIAYRVVAASASTSFDLLAFIRAKEQLTCNLDDLDDWEVVDVDLDLERMHIAKVEEDEDEELQSMLNSWCSMERAGDRMDSQLLRCPPPSLSFVTPVEYQRQMMLEDKERGGQKMSQSVAGAVAGGQEERKVQENGNDAARPLSGPLEEEMAEFEQLEGLEDEWEVVNNDYLFSYDILEGHVEGKSSLVATVPDLSVFLPHLADALAHGQANGTDDDAVVQKDVVEDVAEEEEEGEEERDDSLSRSVLAEDVDDDLL